MIIVQKKPARSSGLTLTYTSLIDLLLLPYANDSCVAMRARAAIRRKLWTVDIDKLQYDSECVVQARASALQAFGFEPCLWQLKVSLASLRGDKHILSISRTGSGKTLTFWLPILLASDGMIIVVVPLKLLGKQNLDQLTRAGISATITIVTGETASDSIFNASITIRCNFKGLITLSLTRYRIRHVPGDNHKPRTLNETRKEWLCKASKRSEVYGKNSQHSYLVTRPTVSASGAFSGRNSGKQDACQPYSRTYQSILHRLHYRITS